MAVADFIVSLVCLNSTTTKDRECQQGCQLLPPCALSQCMPENLFCRKICQGKIQKLGKTQREIGCFISDYQVLHQSLKYFYHIFFFSKTDSLGMLKIFKYTEKVFFVYVSFKQQDLSLNTVMTLQEILYLLRRVVLQRYKRAPFL